MDDRRPTKPSALPRPQSRLPLPRTGAALISPVIPSPSSTTSTASASSSSTLRAAPSREVRNPRLRSSVSQSQIRTQSAAGSRPPVSSGPRRVASKPVLNRVTSQTLRPKPSTDSLPRSAASVSRKNSRESFSRSTSSLRTRPEPPQNDNILPRRKLTLTRRPSEQYLSQSSAALSVSSTDGANSPIVDQTEDSFSLDTVRATPKKPSRPSLSDRTIETLSRLPSSPAIGKTANSFYDPESARRPKSRAASTGSRPGSSHLSDGSTRPLSRAARSRPGSSSGGEASSLSLSGGGPSSFKGAAAAGYKPPLASIRATPGSTPGKRLSTVKSLRNPASRPPVASTPSQFMLAKRSHLSRSPSPEKMKPTPKLNYGPKPGAPRAGAVKSRPSLNGVYRKPSAARAAPSDVRQTLVSPRSSLTSDSNPSSASTASSGGTALTTESGESAPSPAASSRKSSAALRDQIAKAKAAKRAAARQGPQSAGRPLDEEPVVPTDTTFDFGLADDPFNTRKNSSVQSKMIQQRVGVARSSGRLNIAAMNLKEIPEQVMKMYDFDETGSGWAESVDLSRFVAADNELEVIDDSVFPDRDPEEFADEEDSQGSIFGGLETLDMHGNLLISLPSGMRRLDHLTSLNLSSNRLTNNCFEIISKITSLRDLKLSNNLLCGPLDDRFNKLVNLEILDIHNNNVSAFAPGLHSLSSLRIINISENSFESLPFDSLAQLPLTEINARKNKIRGVLIDNSDVESMITLQTLDVSSNQLTHIIHPSTSIAFPALHQITLGMNRLKVLPDVSTWTSLLTLSADENSLSGLPEGFFGLEKLRHADFSSNDIRAVPAEIARMENLAMFRITGNPLREKKFASMTTEDMKVSLATRLEPLPHEIEPEPEPVSFYNMDGPRAIPAHVAEGEPQDNKSDGDFTSTPGSPFTSMPGTPSNNNRSRSHTLSHQTWPVKSGGVLDRSSTQSSSLHPVVCSKVAVDHRVYEAHIHHNLFSTLPNSLSFFAETLRSLSISHNQLVGASYLTEELELPALRELNIASNHITSLQPLMDHLIAPELEKIDVTLNRLNSLPPLRKAFPNLTVLLLSNNHLEDLDPDSIQGMHIVDASNNDISHLNPRLGLLGGSKGTLKRLEVTGNRFRVPRFNVLERGTESTLKWLRSRVPVAEMAAWKRETGGGSSSEGGDLD